MARSPGATKANMDKRVRAVIDLKIKRAIPDHMIVQALMQQEEISEKTARRDIQKAKQLMGALGSQASDEERGLLVGRFEYLASLAMKSETPDLSLANQMLRTQLEIHKTNPGIRSQKEESHAPTSEAPSLSPELTKILERYTKSSQGKRKA